MSETHHPIAPEEIMAYLDGELPAARAAGAMTHLERCSECQKLAADLRRVSQEMAAWQIEPPGAIAPPVALPERSKRSFLEPLQLRHYLVPVVASCLVVGLVVAVSLRMARPPAAVFDREVKLMAPERSFSIYGAPQTASVASAGRVPLSQASPAPPLPPPQFQPAPPASPMIERTATLNLATRDFDQLRGRIDAILARRHGYLAELNLSTPQGAGRSLNASVRVPAAEVDAALADFRQLGRVENESQKGEDVTRAYADLVARLANARNTEQRLTQVLLQRTGKLSDVLDVEREVSRVRGEIEQMEAERRTTADQVAFATVQLNASEDYKAQLRLSPDSTLTRLRNAAVDGYKNLAGGLVGVALVLITYGPSVLLWAALAFLIGLWFAKRRKIPRFRD